MASITQGTDQGKDQGTDQGKRARKTTIEKLQARIADLEETILLSGAARRIELQPLDQLQLNARIIKQQEAISQLDYDLEGARIEIQKLQEQTEQLRKDLEASEQAKDELKKLLRKRMDSAPAKRVEELEAKLAEHERATESRVRQILEQAATIVALEKELAATKRHDVHHEHQCPAVAQVMELEAERKILVEENCQLRAQLANAGDSQRITDLETRLDHANRMINDFIEEKNFHKRLWKSSKIETAHKAVLEAARDHIRSKRDDSGYTRIYAPALADSLGMSRQTVGKRLRDLVDFGALGVVYEYEDTQVKDNRGNLRTIKKTHTNVCLNDLANHPEDLEITDDRARHGGAGERCKECGSANVRRIHHVQCLECGHETILYPMTDDQADQIAELDTVTSAPAPAETSAPAPAPVHEVHHEHHALSLDEINSNIWREIIAQDPGAKVPPQILEAWHKQEKLPTFERALMFNL